MVAVINRRRYEHICIFNCSALCVGGEYNRLSACGSCGYNEVLRFVFDIKVALRIIIAPESGKVGQVKMAPILNNSRDFRFNCKVNIFAIIRAGFVKQLF